MTNDNNDLQGAGERGSTGERASTGDRGRTGDRLIKACQSTSVGYQNRVKGAWRSFLQDVLENI